MRRVRFNYFAALAELPRECSWLRVAVLKWTYFQAPKDGFCPGPLGAALRSWPRDLCEAAEELLHIFHVDLRDAVAALPQGKDIKLHGRMDIAVVEAIMKLPGNRRTAMAFKAVVTAEVGPILFYAHEKLLPKDVDIPLKFLPPTVLEVKAAVAEKSSAIQPRVIEYDDNDRPMNDQEVREIKKERPTADVEYFVWESTSDLRERLNALRSKAAVAAAMAEVYDGVLRETTPVVDGKLDDERLLVRLCLEGDKARVFATKDLPIGTLQLAPMCFEAGSLKDKKTHPDSVELVYQETRAGGQSGRPVSYWLSPEKRLPRWREDGQEVVYAGNELLVPFWHVRRCHQATEWNCELQTVKVRPVTVIHHADKSVVTAKLTGGKLATASVEVPLLSNSRAIAKGAEVVLRWDEPEAPKRKVKVETWEQHIPARGKQQKKA